MTDYEINHTTEDLEDKITKKIEVFIKRNGDIEIVTIDYDMKRNLCKLSKPNHKCIKYLNTILPADCDIWYCGDDAEDLITLGFSNPFYCKKCPFGKKLNDTIAIHKKNDPCFETNSRERYSGEDKDPEIFQNRRSSPKRKTSEEHMFEFITDNHKNNGPIKLNIKFDEGDLNYLKGLVFGSKTLNNNGEITQKEVSGGLHLTKTRNNFILNVDKTKKFNAHDEDSVRLVNGICNFHTHPISIYEELGIDLMYPSPDDYTSILTLLLQPYYFENNNGSKMPCIFSCVISKEGIYIISLNKNYCNRNKIKKLRETICDRDRTGLYSLKSNVVRSMTGYKNGVSGYIYGETIDYNIYYDTHSKYIGDPKNHPLGYKQIGGFDYHTCKHNRKLEHLSQFPDKFKSGKFTYDKLTQASKDYCVKMNRRELISGVKFKEGPVLNIDFYNYEELEKVEFSVYTYSQESEFLSLQPILDEETLDNILCFSNPL